TEVHGEQPAGGFVTGLKYKDRVSGEEHALKVGGVFVEIGLIPNTDIVKGFVEMDKYNRIVADPYTQRTSVEGIWAAGDCTDVRYHQNNIAAGDAVKAIEDMYSYLR
ncbi:MAG: FAD-dependent oxidoreductase, partial [bacterium]|nr:FAD-dependent oxidoreductase [bacterium]